MYGKNYFYGNEPVEKKKKPKITLKKIFQKLGIKKKNPKKNKKK